MNFSLYKADENSNLLKITKQKFNFFKKNQQDVEIFHTNNVGKKMVHVVFHIPDEYHFGTKRRGNELNVPFSQYINAFLFSDSPYFLLELVNDKYSGEVINYIKEKAKTKPVLSSIDRDKFEKIVNKLNGFIKEIEFTTPDDEEETVDSVPLEKFYIINKENHITSVLLNVEKEFVSLNTNGTISVNNSDGDYLIKFTEVIVNALD